MLKFEIREAVSALLIDNATTARFVTIHYLRYFTTRKVSRILN